MLMTLGLFAVWSCGMIFVGIYDYASQYFWLSGSVLAISFAVALVLALSLVELVLADHHSPWPHSSSRALFRANFYRTS